MTTKFTNFVAALEQLCMEHGVDLGVNEESYITVWDIHGDRLTEELIDCTKEQKLWHP